MILLKPLLVSFTILIIGVLLFGSIITSCSNNQIDPYPKRGYLLSRGGVQSYKNGANDALDHLILLDEELSLKQIQMPISEKIQIVRQRLKIEQDGRIKLP